MLDNSVTKQDWEYIQFIVTSSFFIAIVMLVIACMVGVL